ncbi:MAG: HD domain-containing protein [Patescibacteria group bacterium]|nr:HD domain-containing protein [Patescibacteria group bacterium]
MKRGLRDALTGIAASKISGDDPSHDLNHAFRVLSTAEKIAREEKADLDIIVPAALFHDIVNYPKNDPRRIHSADESAEQTKKILEAVDDYPKEKIEKVVQAIRSCSFSKGIVPDLLEAKILQDADGLEATGAISVMRTFASTGGMKRTFYNNEDPFAANRQPDDMKYALDLFFTRLLKVKERMHTKGAKKIAERRTDFLKKFLKEFELELKGK